MAYIVDILYLSSENLEKKKRKFLRKIDDLFLTNQRSFMDIFTVNSFCPSIMIHSVIKFLKGKVYENYMLSSMLIVNSDIPLQNCWKFRRNLRSSLKKMSIILSVSNLENEKTMFISLQKKTEDSILLPEIKIYFQL